VRIWNWKQAEILLVLEHIWCNRTSVVKTKTQDRFSKDIDALENGFFFSPTTKKLLLITNKLKPGVTYNNKLFQPVL